MRKILAALLFIALSGCAKEPLPAPVFDVPSLTQENIQGVEKKLGAPSEYTPPTTANLQGGITEWDKSWEKEGQTLLVTYRLNDGKIVDFFIPTDDPSGATGNKEKLLAIGNASSGEGRYNVEFVKSFGKEGSYTGVKIIPN